MFAFGCDVIPSVFVIGSGVMSTRYAIVASFPQRVVFLVAIHELLVEICETLLLEDNHRSIQHTYLSHGSLQNLLHADMEKSDNYPHSMRNRLTSSYNSSK